MPEYEISIKIYFGVDITIIYKTSKFVFNNTKESTYDNFFEDLNNIIKDPFTTW